MVATDINERALAFAEFNAALNEITNVEFRAGSFFEPVAGEEFDLVVTNPPYVISPESTFLFRDGGLPRDSLSDEVVRGTPAHVTEGGFATVMIELGSTGRTTMSRRGPHRGSRERLDAIVLHRARPRARVAAQWNRDVSPDPDEYGTVIDRWTRVLPGRGDPKIGFGAISCGSARPSRAARTGSRAADADASTRRLGPALEQMFAAQDFLTGLDDPSALLDEPLVVIPQVVLEQRLRLEAGWALRESAWDSSGMRFSAGLTTSRRASSRPRRHTDRA